MKKLLIALFVSLSLAACGDGSVPSSSEGQAVQQASSGHSTGDMLTGGFIGYLLGRMSSPSPTPHVVEHHYHGSTVTKVEQPKQQPAKPVVTEQPKLHAGQAVTVPAKPSTSWFSSSTASAPKTNQYAAASSGVKSYSGSTNSYARSSSSFSSYSSSRSFSSGRR